MANPDILSSKGKDRILTVAESLTMSGSRFYAEAELNLAAGVTDYVLFQMPGKNSGLTVGLQNRQFKSLNGEASIEILWDSDYLNDGVLIESFNENNASDEVSQMEVRSGITVNVEGTVRESDFLTGSGAGSNSSGDVSAELGFRLYKPGTFFIAKITNDHNAENKIKIAYSWVEAPFAAI